MELKKCKICGETKPIAEFEDYITSSGRRIGRFQCRKCRTKKLIERQHKKKAKKCPICLKIKQPFGFVRNNSLDYKKYGGICRECAYKKNKEERQEKLEKKPKKKNEQGKIYCQKCKQYKNKSKFYESSNRPIGYDNTCKECRKKHKLKRYKETKKIMIKKLGDKCRVCGKKFPWYAYDFHHKNGEKKETKISNFTKLTIKHLRTLAEFKEELDKCILVCAICHRKLHINKQEEK